MVDTTDDWIVQRTGMRERRIVSDGESTSTLGTQAAQHALKRAGIAAEELDLIVCGTVTGDMLFPATSCLIQRNIGAKNAGAFDVGAACAGFIYALSTGTAMVQSGMAKTALVLGADVLTRFVDWKDRSTCILFGDAAGAVVIQAEEQTDRGLIASVLLSDGTGADFINLETGGSLHPARDADDCCCRRTIYMNGSEVYRFAVQAMGDACQAVLNKAGMTVDEVDLFVPHQANIRIIESSAKRLGLPMDKVFVNIEKYGNTSGASVPVALSEADAQGRLKKGDVVMTVGFGAGLVWGANLIRW
jgi:3-oxoacyl-[acyl-carrier-protein] synthase-3